MKRSVHFFGAPESKSKMPRVQCHVDGISIPGVGSMRLSNTTKNLRYMVQCLTSLGKKAPVLLFSSFVFFIKKIQAQNDCPTSPFASLTDVYLNHSEGNAFLLVQHDKDTSFTSALNNTCGFFLATKQSDSYNQLGCACAWQFCGGIPPSSATFYDVILSAQNITDPLKKCMEDFLNN